jgi:hypothetical protein
MKPLTIIGFVITVIWLGVIGIIYEMAPDKVLSLNEWGDFLAGIMAPLAFLWLVIGYFQQGKELAGQVKETALLGEYMLRQAMATEEQVRLEKMGVDKDIAIEKSKAQPILVSNSHSVTNNRENEWPRKLFINFRNIGGRISNLNINTERDLEIKIYPETILEENGKGRINIFFLVSCNTQFYLI